MSDVEDMDVEDDVNLEEVEQLEYVPTKLCCILKVSTLKESTSCIPKCFPVCLGDSYL